jgi:general secretion pathway protein D
MTSHSLASRARSLLLICSFLAGAGMALAQTNSAPRPAGSAGGVGGGAGGVVSGGSAGSGTGTNGTRQYTNSTMLGDALITSDMDSRNLIVVTDEQTYEVIKGIVADLDRPRPQVLIDCVFVQVTLTNELDLGTELSYTGPDGIGLRGNSTTSTQFGLGGANGLISQPAAVGSTPSPSSPSSNGLFYSLTSNNVSATIHSLAATNKTEILSRPSILTRSNQQATVLVGEMVPIVNGFTPITSTTGGTELLSTVVQQDVGIILKVTPFITSEGNVEMILDPEISSLSADTVSIGNGVNSPIINMISADTVVVTPNNQKVVIGGLISTQNTSVENKVPLLGDIPGLGYLFKYTTKNKQRTELIVFMTPHIVRDPSDLMRASRSENSKMDLTPKSFDKAELKKDDATPQ